MTKKISNSQNHKMLSKISTLFEIWQSTNLQYQNQTGARVGLVLSVFIDSYDREPLTVYAPVGGIHDMAQRDPVSPASTRIGVRDGMILSDGIHSQNRLSLVSHPFVVHRSMLAVNSENLTSLATVHSWSQALFAVPAHGFCSPGNDRDVSSSPR
jgi:hypothetical protein